MAKVAIGFADWPFPKGERTKLIKISKPYVEDGKWYVSAEYLSVATSTAKFIKHFFGDLHLLVVGADYIDGIRQSMPNWKTVDVPFPPKCKSIKQYEPYLKKDKRKCEFDYYTFGIDTNKGYYIIPLVEIVRAALAPDVFWLNQITLLDSIDIRVLHEYDGKVLNLNFSPDVPVRYVKMDSAIKHMAWIFSNSSIYNMLDQLYHNIQAGRGILFDFLFEELEITAKFEEWDGRNYVKEIVACRSKKINCEEIIVTHHGLVEYDESDGNLDDNGQRNRRGAIDNTAEAKELVSNVAAAPKSLDIEKDDIIHCEYISAVKIKRVKTPQIGNKSKNVQIQSDDDIKTNRRTTADFEGLDTVPQLEFSHIAWDKLEGDFAEMQAVLNLMGKRKEVASVKCFIGYLNDHLRYRSICTLDDGGTPRQFLIGKIRLNDGSEAALLEIQRESMAISTVLCVSCNWQDWNLIFHKILKGFIRKSGVWPDFKEIGLESIEVYRFKHTDVEFSRKEKRIFESIKQRNGCKN